MNDSSYKKLAMFNSFAGYGRCSTTIALPVISAMGVQVCPVPTSILSSHLAYPTVQKLDYTPYMQEYIHAWKEIGASFDGLYCGFMNHATQVEIAKDFLTYFKPKVFLLDPVMGDHGKRYNSVTPKQCAFLKDLAASADILTPNLTEACLLTDTPYKEEWSAAEIQTLLEALSKICPGKIVITGICENDTYTTYLWENGQMSTCVTPSAGPSRHGAGDLFASILIAEALQDKDFHSSVEKATKFIAKCITESEKAKIPSHEGLLFEKLLQEL